MTAELTLLLAIYAFLVIGLFLHPEYGVQTTFKENLPLLSARIEQNVATGGGFSTPSVHDRPLEWSKP